MSKSIWWFFEQFVFVNNHLQCYWPTIHDSILKIYPKFQVLSSHLFEVHELLDEKWAKIVQSENISTPICVKCNKIYLSIGLRSRILRAWPWYSTSVILNQQFCTQKSCCRLWNTSSNMSNVFSADWHEPMGGSGELVEWFKWVAESQATWVRFQHGSETLCRP